MPVAVMILTILFSDTMESLSTSDTTASEIAHLQTNPSVNTTNVKLLPVNAPPSDKYQTVINTGSTTPTVINTGSTQQTLKFHVNMMNTGSTKRSVINTGSTKQSVIYAGYSKQAVTNTGSSKLG